MTARPMVLARGLMIGMTLVAASAAAAPAQECSPSHAAEIAVATPEVAPARLAAHVGTYEVQRPRGGSVVYRIVMRNDHLVVTRDGSPLAERLVPRTESSFHLETLPHVTFTFFSVYGAPRTLTVASTPPIYASK